ncbi:thioredoxin O1, mitochondrial-like [Pyrus x bretschneideri]|uniref:thioredoxin O1, mitochondrial-like n=1 Tax=Pyrus x bretschneideri TaxID=225117 RepID=UPI002030509A|nr:thioredoxin O1, mitochondrial-like [Pyrus x bretschneideri]
MACKHSLCIVWALWTRPIYLHQLAHLHIHCFELFLYFVALSPIQSTESRELNGEGLGNSHGKFCAALLRRHNLPSNSFQTLASSIPTAPSPPPTASPSTSKPFSNSLHHFPNPHFLQLRPLSSSPSGASNIVVIKSEDEFSSAVSKAKDGAVPALFYFTAVWCGPCRIISPIIGELREQYPHVTTYKVDIDEKALQTLWTS